MTPDTRPATQTTDDRLLDAVTAVLSDGDGLTDKGIEAAMRCLLEELWQAQGGSPAPYSEEDVKEMRTMLLWLLNSWYGAFPRRRPARPC